MAIGPQLKWIKSGLKKKLQLVVLFIISLLISFLIVKNLDVNFLINTILIGSAFYLFFITIRDFFLKGFKNIQQNIAHFGFSLLILSILFNNIFSSELITNLKVGESFKNDRFEIIFNNLKKFEEKNYISFKGNFSIRENEIEDELEPELRIYNQPNIITSEADIKTTFFTDKFITMNTVQNEEYFNIRYQVKPFMLWIWISVFLISLGGLLSLLKKNYVK
jgi:cytochrome c-type biogenesis protein CcmF